MSNISLKKLISRRNIDISLLLKAQAELKLAYNDIGDNSAIINNSLSLNMQVSTLKKMMIPLYAVYILGTLYRSMLKMGTILQL